jgi:hypothetical protein
MISNKFLCTNMTKLFFLYLLNKIRINFMRVSSRLERISTLEKRKIAIIVTSLLGLGFTL